MDWQDYTFLQSGSQRQQAAYLTLAQLAIFSVLDQYNPVLVGTIPLDIDTESSDLDIICEVHNFIAFENLIYLTYSHYPKFRVSSKPLRGVHSLIANFEYCSFSIEIFGQAKPVTEQWAYRHLVVEDRLLRIAGVKAREAIRSLKQSGVKTEPAFAQYFGIVGDPYEVLFELSRLSEDELQVVISS